MDVLLRETVRESFLAELPDDAIMPLLDGATRVDVPAGTRLCYPDLDSRPSIRLIARGLVRIALHAPDGRAITQRYLRRGEFGGIPIVFSGRQTPGQCHSLTDSTFYVMNTDAWRSTAHRDAGVATLMLEEVSRVLVDSVDHLVAEVLATTRQRLVRQLLDIAADNQNGEPLVAPVTQQELAEGIGSAREVVARALRGLRDEQLVTTGRGGVVILDPIRLQSELLAI